MNHFIFIDESGTSNSESIPQPFYVVGLLQIEAPNLATRDLLQKHNSYYSEMRQRRRVLFNELASSPRPISREEINNLMLQTNHTEYHHNQIGPTNIERYKGFIDTVFNYPIRFCALVIDRNNPNFNEKIYRNYWKAYVSYVKLLCEHNCKAGEKYTVISDYLNAPRGEIDSFARELESTGAVHNLLQCHSHGVPLLQVCDLLTGAVNFDCRAAAGFTKTSNKATAKKEFSRYVASKFGITDKNPFAKKATYNAQPHYFSVWPLQLKKEK